MNAPKVLLLFTLFIFAFSTQLTAQAVPMVLPANQADQGQIAASPSTVFSAQAAAMVDPKTMESSQGWDVNLSYFGRTHGNELPENYIDSLKHQKSLLKLASPSSNEDETELNSQLLVETPVVNTNFKGNTFNGWFPPDNNIAVSDGGDIVSVTNSSLIFADASGNVNFENSFSNWFSVLNLSGGYFDPKILYDPSEDKFIMIVLNGNTPSSSSVVLAFSTTDDPNDPWWFYVFDGDPDAGTSWFDFPSIGVSETELYVSGNLYNSNDQFTGALIYQVEKQGGFFGGNISWLYYSGINDSNGFSDFNVVPISYGFDGWIGPGIFFLSSDSGGGSQVMMYYSTGTINDNPQLVVNAISVGSYSVSGDGQQQGTSELLNTNDCRLLSGFYAEGIIHFTMNTSVFSVYNGIYYGRVDVSALTGTSSTFGLSGYEYCFPSIAPFTTSFTGQDVLIAFLRTGSDIYPEFRVVSVDDDYEWSSSVLVRSGDSFVDIASGSTERWGDYSGISRRHLLSEVEVWVSGCYGENSDGGSSNILSTWVAQISNNGSIQAPAANFVANQTVIAEGQSVNFTDLSSNNPDEWDWDFPGGSPGSSAQQNPTITYNTAGTYTVNLFVSNAGGSDTEVKVGYITVLPDVQAPVANFTANQTTITEGQTINFTDQSTNNPTGWNWSFPGSLQGSSSQQNPSGITYQNAGNYSVTLTSTNSAGSDSETKNQYITVLPGVVAPVSDFEADQTNILAGGIVNFTDLTQNEPDMWSWSFVGGQPNSSTLQDPIIIYPNAGVYNVSLVASNSAGSNSNTKTGYIIVGEINSIISPDAFSGFKIYPNPSTGAEVAIDFDIPEARELEFFVVDITGRVVKLLMERRFKAGRNLIYFNSDALAAGTYFILVQDSDKTFLRNEKMVIVH